ncbi:MAG: hypothetical protein RLZZ502_1593 [Pseudomonadota bacterium]|jgi:hypothetical protein
MNLQLSGKLQAPERVKAGESFSVQLLLRHAMETGFISDAQGQRQPQNLIRKIEFFLDDTALLRLTPSSGLAANPYLQISLSIPRSGKLICRWQDEQGAQGELSQKISTT